MAANHRQRLYLRQRMNVAIKTPRLLVLRLSTRFRLLFWRKPRTLVYNVMDWVICLA